ncbi:hypothetical protein DSECCO2_584640 [anaerobic digester metagenome]
MSKLRVLYFTPLTMCGLSAARETAGRLMLPMKLTDSFRLRAVTTTSWSPVSRRWLIRAPLPMTAVAVFSSSRKVTAPARARSLPEAVAWVQVLLNTLETPRSPLR